MATRIRIPTPEDFEPLSPALKLSLHFPNPPESTTAILILFHGLGDSESSFATFARNMSLPGVLAISVRGTSPLPPALLGETFDSGPPQHFHWGDDLNLAPGTGELDPDPGFKKAADLVTGRLMQEILIEKCGWELSDILLFGFGQGGSLALGLASKMSTGSRIEDLKADEGKKTEDSGRKFKGVISIGGPLPHSMIPTISTRGKSKTPVLLCHGSASDAIDEDTVDTLRHEFADVRITKWKKPDDSMPRSRDEMLPIMQFFARMLSNASFS